MLTHQIKALLLTSGDWVEVRYGSARLVPATLIDTNTPGDAQSVLLRGSETFLESRLENTLAIAGVVPMLLRFRVPHREDVVFAVDPNTVQAWQIVEEVELQSADHLPPSVVDLSADHSHLEERPYTAQIESSTPKTPPRRRR